MNEFPTTNNDSINVFLKLILERVFFTTLLKKGFSFKNKNETEKLP
jgi:hypothetical protein